MGRKAGDKLEKGYNWSDTWDDKARYSYGAANNDPTEVCKKFAN